jgi:hypothetical protein
MPAYEHLIYSRGGALLMALNAVSHAEKLRAVVGTPRQSACYAIEMCSPRHSSAPFSMSQRARLSISSRS